MIIQTTPDVTTRIGILLIDGFSLMSFAASVEPFRAANLIAGQPLFTISVYSVSGKTAQSSNLAQVPVNGAATDIAGIDLLLVIAGGASEAILRSPTHTILRKLARQRVTIGGVSGGALLLASARVVDGRRITAHWEHREAFNQLGGDFILERSIYVIDGNRVTCAGGTAPIDLCHALISQRHGTEFARKVTDWFLHTEIRGAQSAQQSSLAERWGTRNPILLEAIEQMNNHISDPLSAAQLALLLGVSSRHLARLFHREFDKTVVGFYTEMRLEAARRLVLQTSLPLTEIALTTGFANSSHFSASFKKHFNTPPGKLRRQKQAG